MIAAPNSRVLQKDQSRSSDDARLFSGEISSKELEKENAISSLFDMERARVEEWV